MSAWDDATRDGGKVGASVPTTAVRSGWPLEDIERIGNWSVDRGRLAKIGNHWAENEIAILRDGLARLARATLSAVVDPEPDAKGTDDTPPHGIDRPICGDPDHRHHGPCEQYAPEPERSEPDPQDEEFYTVEAIARRVRSRMTVEDLSVTIWVGRHRDTRYAGQLDSADAATLVKRIVRLTLQDRAIVDHD